MQKTHMRECAISLLKDKPRPTPYSRTIAPEQKDTHPGFIPTRPHGKDQTLRTFTAKRSSFTHIHLTSCHQILVRQPSWNSSKNSFSTMVPPRNLLCFRPICGGFYFFLRRKKYRFQPNEKSFGWKRQAKKRKKMKEMRHRNISSGVLLTFRFYLWHLTALSKVLWLTFCQHYTPKWSHSIQAKLSFRFFGGREEIW